MTNTAHTANSNQLPKYPQSCIVDIWSYRYPHLAWAWFALLRSLLADRLGCRGLFRRCLMICYCCFYKLWRSWKISLVCTLEIFIPVMMNKKCSCRARGLCFTQKEWTDSWGWIFIISIFRTSTGGWCFWKTWFQCWTAIHLGIRD